VPLAFMLGALWNLADDIASNLHQSVSLPQKTAQ
jgi:hypothetical protein